MQNAMFVVRRGEPVPGITGEDEPEAGSFAAFVDRHSRLVFRIALAIVRSPHDAEDVVQETFLQVYKGNRWRQIEDERGYLARVAWRLAVRQRKLAVREQELSPETRSRRASPEELAMDRQLESWLHGRIDALPEKLRQPLALAALGELKLVEIAKVLGLPEGTVRRRMHTARARLRQELAERKGGSHEQR
jgi:RNA polymerase sigma-70 factor (ECF subfamily)